MDTPLPQPPAETDAEREARIAWERACVKRAEAQIDAGLFIDSADIDAWIDSLDTEDELPRPRPQILRQFD